MMAVGAASSSVFAACEMTASMNEEAGTISATFANHSDSTNGLYLVWGDTDRGCGTNAWDHVEYLGTVAPTTNEWTCAIPSGWGEEVQALRLVLSEVPYDLDCTLDYLYNNGTNRICLTDFEFKGNYRVVMDITRVKFIGGNPAFFSTRNGGNNSPYVTLFEIGGTSWRMDYNDKTGTNVSSPTLADGTRYLIDASYLALKVNGMEVASRASAATFFDTKASQGQLEFFCGNTMATSRANADHTLRLYSAQIYDYLENATTVKDSPDLLVNLIPAVKGGVIGAYDTVRGVFYTSDTGSAFELEGASRQEEENPFFTSAVIKVAISGPEVFTPATDTVDATDYTNSSGGILVGGTNVLTLTGNNDWGGRFVITNGILQAAFGQGLGANDRLVFANTHSFYAGWDGLVTNRLGTGAAELTAENNGYLGFAAVDREVTVNLGGAQEPETWTPSSSIRRLELASKCSDVMVDFTNPISIPNDITLILRNYIGSGRISGNIQVQDMTANGPQVSLYGEEIPPFGTTELTGKDNRFKTYYQYSGGYIFGEGSTNLFSGNMYVAKGTFLATNAIIRATGEAAYSCAFNVQAAKAVILGGEFTAGGCSVGVSDSTTQSTSEYLQPALTIGGKFILDGSLSDTSYGSMTVYSDCASAAVTFLDGAEVQMVNLNLHRRNLYHHGGTVKLTGSYGLNQFGQSGTARYHLGGRLEMRCINFVEGKTANFVFNGGTLATNQKTDDGNFATNLGGNNTIEVNPAAGGTFEANHDATIDGAILHSTVYGGSWQYSAAGYLTAPAFKKTGAQNLVVTGACTYKCATDIAEGTLKLAGESAALPETGVVRLTGGTLDLDGKTLTVKALAGTAGKVANGGIRVTEAIYPGGKSTIGSFTVSSALEGALEIDCDKTAGCDLLTIDEGTTLDLSALDLTLAVSGEYTAADKHNLIIAGKTTGEFRSITGLPSGWSVRITATGVKVGRIQGMAIILR